MKYIKNGELKDKEIVEAIHIAAKEYEVGALLEARDRLQGVIDAINTWNEVN